MKVEQELSNKIGTIEALTIQLKRKDETLESISMKFSKIEQQQQQQQNRTQNVNKGGKIQDADIKKL